ncbi:MAG: hypothetical protein K8S99_08530 [Planctomycetes bacterium]|nr:hypothetical protein [Planctomycetota bacterium]
MDSDASYRVANMMAGHGDGLAIGARTLRKRLQEKGLIIHEGKKDTLTVRRVLEGQLRGVLRLASGVLYQQTDISDIPDTNSAIAGNETEDEIHSTDGPTSSSPPMSPVSAGDGRNVRNVRKGGDLPSAAAPLQAQVRKAVMEV